MRMTRTVCGSWVLSALIGCVSLGKKSPGALDGDLVARDRRAAEMCNARGLELVEQSEWDEAERVFRRSKAHDLGYAAARNNLGLVLLHQGRVPEAIRELIMAQEVNPEAAAPQHNVAQLERVFNMNLKSHLEVEAIAASEKTQRGIR